MNTLSIRRVLRSGLGVKSSLVAITLFLSSCGGEPPLVSRATIDTLENGAVLIQNPAEGLWNERSAWRLVEEVTIGTRDGQGPEAFGQVVDVDVDRFGRIYVLDLFAQEIQVFDSGGTYVRTIGRRGRGPGEFRGVNGMTFDPAGRLWVLNQGNQRYSVFDTSGMLLQELRRPMLSRALVANWNGVFSRVGDLYDWVIYHDSTTARAPHSAFARYDTTTNQFVDYLPWPVLPEGTMFGWGHHLRTRSGWWSGVASEYRLHETTPEGDTIRVVERAHDRIRLAGEERDSAVQLLERARVIGDMKAPTHRRIFDRFMVDDEDYLWVMLSPEPDAPQGTTFDVFDPEGLYLGDVTTSHRAESLNPLPVIRGDKMVFLTKDEFDVPFVVMMAIEGRYQR